MTGEWPLIIFTILAQMAVGAFVVLGTVHMAAVRRAGPAVASAMSERTLLAIGPIFAIGLMASLAHLGNPRNAPFALLNVGSSWLSREILFALLFAGVGAGFALLQWRKIGGERLRLVVGAATALLGLALLYSMARVYMLESHPAWNLPTTPVTFFTTAFLLGALIVGAGMTAAEGMPGRGQEQGALGALRGDLLRWIAVAVAVLLVAEVVTVAAQIAMLAAGEAAAASSAALLVTRYGALLALRLLLVTLGVAAFALAVRRGALRAEGERSRALLVYIAFALVLAGEVVGRYLFYVSQVKAGL